MAARQSADLLKLIEWRRRKPEPCRFALIDLPHIQQGTGNCGATSCAIVARWQGVMSRPVIAVEPRMLAGQALDFPMKTLTKATLILLASARAWKSRQTRTLSDS